MSQTKTLENSSYLNKSTLKPAGVQIPWTQEQVKEWIRCSQDCEYFVKNYYKIVHVDHGLIQFSPYEYQLTMLREVVNNRHVIAKWSRQSGKSTIMAAVLLWYALFNKDFTIAILAHRLEGSKEILSRIKYAYEFIPKWLQQGIVEWNMQSIVLENGSKIFADATTAASIRGKSLNIAYLDEFAFVPTNIAEKFFTSVYPTISSGLTTKLIITSTPQGLNYFYNIWRNSELGRNSYKRVSINWWDTPGRDEAWKETTLLSMNGNIRKFEEEYGCEFLGSSKTLIGAKIITSLIHDEPIKQNESGLKIYVDPIPGHVYLTTVDTSKGLAEDFSCFIVFDITCYPFTISAIYRNNEIEPLIFPNIIHDLTTFYNNSYVLVERNESGDQVVTILQIDLGNEYLLYTTSRGRKGQQISFDYISRQTVPGVTTSKTTKRQGCLALRALVENKKLIINDFDLINEISRFAENKTGSWAAEEGNDDLVMCCVLFGWCSTQTFMQNISDNSSLRKTLEDQRQQRFRDQMAPIGIPSFQDDSMFDEVVDLTRPDTYVDFNEYMRR